MLKEGNRECIDILLKPSKNVIDTGLPIRNETFEKRQQLWEEITANAERYKNGECDTFLKDLNAVFLASFDVSLLLLSLAFRQNNEQFEGTSYFNAREIEACETIERYSYFESLTRREIEKRIRSKDDKTLALLKEYAVSTKQNMDEILGDAEIRDTIRSYLKKRWNNNTRNMVDAIACTGFDLDCFSNLPLTSNKADQVPHAIIIHAGGSDAAINLGTGNIVKDSVVTGSTIESLGSRGMTIKDSVETKSTIATQGKWDEVLCPACKTAVKPGAKYCTSCGIALKQRSENRIDTSNFDELNVTEIMRKKKIEDIGAEIRSIDQEIQRIYDLAKESSSKSEEVSYARQIKSLLQKKEMKRSSPPHVDENLQAVSNNPLLKDGGKNLTADSVVNKRFDDYDLEKRSNVRDLDVKEAEAGIELLRKMKAAKREDAARYQALELEKAQKSADIEAQRLKARSTINNEAQISLDESKAGEQLTEIAKKKQAKALTEEQLIALSAKNRPAVAAALKEKYGSEQVGAMYEQRMKDQEVYVQRMQQMEERAMDRMEHVLSRSLEEMGQTAIPDLTIALNCQHLDFDCWNRMTVQITNNGKSDAFSVILGFPSDFEIRWVSPSNVKAGDSQEINIGIRPKTLGEIPIDVTLHYSDSNNQDYTKKFKFWIVVQQFSESKSSISASMSAPRITIQNSVLQHSNLPESDHVREPKIKSDPVHFTVSGPAQVKPKSTFILNISAHLENQRIEVEKRAKKFHPNQPLQVTTIGPHVISQGIKIVFNLAIDDLILDNREECVLWNGEIASANFLVKVPESTEQCAHGGTIRVFVEGVSIARINFLIEVHDSSSQQHPSEISSEVFRYKKAFVSYSSKDRNLVLARVQGIQKVAPDLKIKMDIQDLRSGEKWKEKLREYIDQCDIFYLFWSRNAKESSWVDKEWRCAYNRKGIDFIDPVPLESPELVPPPVELSEKHFSDWVLAYMRITNS